MPKIIKVHEGDDSWNTHGFDEKTSCHVIEDAVDDDPERGGVFTFYVNVDNLYLKTDMKATTEDVALKEAKFVYGNVLVGLALLHDRTNGTGRPEQEDEPEDPSVIVRTTTQALAPFLVPMIDYLGALTPDEVAGLAETGDED